MKLTVVQCRCGNPEPHRKLRTEDGRKTRGFFSVEEGEGILEALLASGKIEQTDEERAATKQELESCGSPQISEDVLRALAHVLKGFPRKEWLALVLVSVVAGVFTPEEGERILALAAE
jgi:hypothetical protein